MWQKLNKETNQWEPCERSEELWNKYLDIQREVFSIDDWNNADDSTRQRYSGKVVKKLLRSWQDGDITDLVPLLYNARNVREWQILRDMRLLN